MLLPRHPQCMRRTLVTLALLVLGALPSAAGAVTLQGHITRAVDGDTVKVEVRGFEDTVRLIGIDTPETKRPGTPVQCFGPQASAWTARLLPPGREVRLVTDPTQDTRDRYGRLLAYVYTAGRSGAAGSVNYGLVVAGFARAYVYDPSGPFRYASGFLGAERRARRSGAGLWGPPCDGVTDRPAPSGATRAARGASGRCDPHYVGACVPLSSSDVDCDQVPGPVRVVGADPDHLDGDGDGRACEG